MPAGIKKPELDTERGVSPAISVVLMVSVALLIAAVIGAVVLGLGEETEEPAPVVSVEFDRTTVDNLVAGNEEIRIKHENGDSVPVSELQISTSVECFEVSTLLKSTSRSELSNFPVDAGTGIENSNNVVGDKIIETANNAYSADDNQLVVSSSNNDELWEAGEELKFQIDDDECNVRDTAQIDVDLIHKPSNSRIAGTSIGEGLNPAELQTKIEPATAGATSTHTLVLDGISYSGGTDDNVDKIQVDYNTDASMDGLNETDITVEMTRTTGTPPTPDRSDITVNSGDYSGSTATFDLSGSFNTDVAGPIIIKIRNIENPSTEGTYDVDITLEGEAGAPTETFTETIDIDS